MSLLPETSGQVEDPDSVEDPDATAATTARPPFRPSELARHLEASRHRSTQPPEPSCEMLRDSCRALRLADLALEEIAVGWGDSEGDARRR